MDITHIISCLYKFSIAIRNPAPKDRLHKIALIDVSFYKNWDLNHIEEKFRQVDNEFRVAKYLIERLGKANTRRRQLLKYYAAHHKTISRYIDDPLPSGSVIEENELANASKPEGPTMEGASAPEKAPDIERAVTVYTTTKSQTTVSTIKVETSQVVEIEQVEEDRLSQTSYATSTNRASTMRICVPSPPDEDAAYEGKEFQCPYCFKIIKVKSRQGWKYVGT